MSQLVKIVENGENIKIYTPYSKDFVKEIKSRVGGAKWNSDDSCWIASLDSIEIVREIMRDVYGIDDLMENDDRKVTVKVTFESVYDALCDSCRLLGKEICIAKGRDSGGKAGRDVIFLKGKPTSGGSMRNWYSIVDKGCVVLLKNVSAALWEKFCEVPQYGIVAELVSESIDRDALEKERAELLTRLAEINRLLGEE